MYCCYFIGIENHYQHKRADEEASVRVIHQVLDIGINFIDTANIYAGSESERIIGKALIRKTA
jgi:1-deoxyxylulose-5-phosphate synthase